MFVFFDVENNNIAQKFLAGPITMLGKEHYVQVSHKSQAQESTLNMHRVFLSNIPMNLTDKELRDFFTEHFGKVGSAFSIKNDKGNSRGYGFIDFMSKEVAEKVVETKKI